MFSSESQDTVVSGPSVSGHFKLDGAVFGLGTKAAKLKP